MHCIELDVENLDWVLSKRRKADILKFECKDYDSDRNITDHTLRKLAQIIASNKNMKEIKIACYGCEEISDVGLQHLTLAIKKLSSLKRASLKFTDCEKLTEKGISGLLRNVQRSHCLESFADFTPNYQMKKPFKFLRSIKHLRDLGLIFGEKSTVAEVQILEKALKSITPLRKLKIVFKEQEEETYEALIQQLIPILTYLGGSLKNFTLSSPDIENEELTDDTVERLGMAFGTFTCVENFTLDFECVIMQEGQAKKLFANFKKMKFLKSLALRTNMNRYEVEEMMENLRDLMTLKSIKIDLYNNDDDLSDFQIMKISDRLRSLKFLEKIHLELYGCCIREIGMGSLNQALKELNHLKKLKLNFSECKKIDDRAIKMLCDGFNSHSLIKLALDFSECELVTNKGVIAISGLLKNLPFLGKIELSLLSLGKIDDFAVAELGPAFEGLDCLEKVSLFLNRCNRITQTAKNKINKIIEAQIHANLKSKTKAKK